LPTSQRGFDFEFLGLVGLADPLRPGVREAIVECKTAGITVVMITGDYPTTAQAIARQAGLRSENVVSGTQLERMHDADLSRAVQNTTVFARIMPEQKLRIVNAIKANGDTVAMTGDGVNDAPSLKAAHIGIAMGGRGTDVAREAASIVLLDDDFGSIVRTIRLGRRIYDNLRKAMAFIIAVHVPIAGLALLPLMSGLPIILGPMHIALLEMVIDPVCSLVFEAEPEEDDIMRRHPRHPEEPLLPQGLVVWSFLQGAFVLMLVSGVFIAAMSRDIPENEVRALTFYALVVGIIGLVFVNRSFSSSVLTALGRRNWILALVLADVVATMSLTMLYPAARNLFGFGPLHADDLAVVFAAGVLVFVVLDGLKFLYARSRR
jgi:Ca2+-transporting ATPase